MSWEPTEVGEETQSRSLTKTFFRRSPKTTESRTKRDFWKNNNRIKWFIGVVIYTRKNLRCMSTEITTILKRGLARFECKLPEVWSIVQGYWLMSVSDTTKAKDPGANALWRPVLRNF